MNVTEPQLNEQLNALRLLTVQEHYAALASEAAQKQWTHVDYLARLIEGEAQRRQELAIQRRIAAARFPCIKTLDQFDLNWPRNQPRPGSESFPSVLAEKANVIFVGGVGLGKSALGHALGYAACLAGHRALHQRHQYRQHPHRRPSRPIGSKPNSSDTFGLAYFVH